MSLSIPVSIFAGVVATLSAAGSIAAQSRSSSNGLADSYARARAVVDSAVVAHGGLDALRAATRFTQRMEGHDVWRNQSRRVEPPYDTEPATGTIALDLAQGRFVWTATSAFPGGFKNASRTVIDGARGFSANLRQRTFVNVPNRNVWTQRGLLYRFPHMVLLSVLDDAASLRWIGDLTVNGERVRAVTFATPQGQQLTLGFDPNTKLLRSISSMIADPLAGDITNETVFSDYRRSGSLMIPGRRVVRWGGEEMSEYRYGDLTVGATIPDTLLAPPAGFTEAAPPAQTPAVKELGPGVWDVRGAGYHALVVAFNDHMFVMEAPGGGSAEIIARVKELAAGKPIRHVAPTHHHDDHAGGMRDFIAEGATIITTPGNRAYFERMGNARRTISPDAQALRPQPVRIETISGKRRVLTDGSRTVELIDIGPSPHANEMLVAWLPAEGILFQGDLLNLGGRVFPTTANLTTAHFADWVKRRGLPVRTIAGVHMDPGPASQLEEAVSQARAAGELPPAR
jgi:glyoxylase-like metal-dependent hydrolase (beta-lactamase superfamily II)